MLLLSVLKDVPPDAKYPYTLRVTPNVYRRLARVTAPLGTDVDFGGVPMQLEIETKLGLVIIPHPELKINQEEI